MLRLIVLMFGSSLHPLANQFQIFGLTRTVLAFHIKIINFKAFQLSCTSFFGLELVRRNLLTDLCTMIVNNELGFGEDKCITRANQI